MKIKMIKKNISIDLDIDLDTDIQSMACLGKIMSISNKQHLSKIWGSTHEKVKQHRVWVEKMCCL